MGRQIPTAPRRDVTARVDRESKAVDRLETL
jgi:hypothetical protein